MIARHGFLGPLAGHAPFVHHEVDIDGDILAILRKAPHRIGRTPHGILSVWVSPTAILGDVGKMELAGLFVGKEQPQIFVTNSRRLERLEPLAAKREPHHAGRQRLPVKQRHIIKHLAHRARSAGGHLTHRDNLS